MAANNDANMAALQGMTIAERYESQLGLNLILHRIGVTGNQRTRIVTHDQFTTLRLLIEQYRDDIDGFKTYLEDLNKRLGGSGRAELRVNYSPAIITRFVGVIHYFNQCISTMHKLPDILNITSQQATRYGRYYKTFINQGTTNDDDDTEVKVPILTGSSNWTVGMRGRQ